MTNNEKCNVFNKENLLNFVTAVLFDDSNIYNLVFRLLNCLFKKEEKEIISIMKQVIFKNNNVFLLI